MREELEIRLRAHGLSPRPVALCVIAVVALALGLSACTSSPGQPTAAKSTPRPANLSPADAVLLAAQRSIADGSARFSVDISVTGSTSVNTTGTGAVDFANSTAQLSLSIPQLGAGGKVTVIEAGGNVYENLAGISGLKQVGLGGKSWVEIPAKSALAESNQSEEMGDPAGFLQALSHRGMSVKVVGHSVIDGVNVTGYDVNLSDSTIKSVPTSLQSSVQSMLRNAKMEVWIDGSGLLRRLEFSTPPSSTLDSAAVKMSMTLFDYGAPVQVSVPPQSEVISPQALLKGQGGNGGGLLSGLGSEGKASFYTNS